jgi:Nif-specific regulatory protein
MRLYSSRNADEDGSDSRARQIQLSQRESGALGLLGEVAGLLETDPGSNQEVLRSVLRLLAEQLDLQRSAIGLLGPTRHVLLIECSRDLSGDELARLRYAPGVIGAVLRGAEPIARVVAGETPWPARDPSSERSRPNSGRVQVCAPIRDGAVVIGALSGELPNAPAAQLSLQLRALTLVGTLVAPRVARTRALQPDVGASFGAEAGDGMREVLRLIGRVAAADVHVLIQGETGAGKEWVAQALHSARLRRASQDPSSFAAIRCGSLGAGSLAQELRDVLERKRAGGVTVLLDDVDELDAAAQAQLFDWLERGPQRRSLAADVWLVATTREDLLGAVRLGRFRPDLYYRLHEFPIEVPPLRERRADIGLLAQSFLERFSALHGRRVTRISEGALSLLLAYDFPGNVRELQNCISRAVLLAHDGVIRQHHLPRALQPTAARPAQVRALSARLREHERTVVSDALARARGDRMAAASALGTTPRVLAYRLKKLELAGTASNAEEP